MILKIYLLKVKDLLKTKKKVDYSRKKTIAESVKLRRQKAYDEEGNDSDEFIDIPVLERDKEEVKEGKGLKILSLKKLLTRLPILLP